MSFSSSEFFSWVLRRFWLELSLAAREKLSISDFYSCGIRGPEKMVVNTGLIRKVLVGSNLNTRWVVELSRAILANIAKICSRVV